MLIETTADASVRHIRQRNPSLETILRVGVLYVDAQYLYRERTRMNKDQKSFILQWQSFASLYHPLVVVMS